jgi:1-acyl-sn-glycerol-3-phosphate acyltransferase
VTTEGRAAAPGRDDETVRRLLLREVERLLADLHLPVSEAVSLESEVFADLGLDSLAVVELHDRLERLFGVRLGEEVMSKAKLSAWLEAIEIAQTGVPAASSTTRSAIPRSFVPLVRAVGGRWPTGARTLTDVLAWHAAAHPDLVTVRLIGEAAGSGPPDLSYGSLVAEASSVAAGILAGRVERGERVAIMLPTQRSYFSVFMGVLLAGCIPVPIYPPVSMANLGEHLTRQSRLLRNAAASMLITVPEARFAARLVRAQVPSLRAVRTPDELVGSAGSGDDVGLRATAQPDDVALIQYTSGSTGDPKGVVLTHSQLLSNIRAMGDAARVTTSDVFVSWLPLYHDMGLIGAFLAPLYFGMPLVVMSPLAFLARPAVWLQAITDYRGSLSAAPNFAYQSCVDRISDEELATLDLSSWRMAFNGSEQVSASTVVDFERRFAPKGFRHETMCPAYGLAEAGVGLAFTPVGAGPAVETVERGALERSRRAMPVEADTEGAVTLVSCGLPLPGIEIKVAGPRGEELPDRHEGHVLCRGPSATAGYYDNDEANQKLWRHGWLDTGDLGYVGDGLLFLTGRAKDIIIRAGRNLHPEELELALGNVEGVLHDGVAVFAASDERLGTEGLVVVVETDLDSPEKRGELETRLHLACLEVLTTAPDRVVVVRPGSIRRTTTGKIRRAATRDALLAGTLEQKGMSVPVQLARFALSGVGPAARRAGRRTTSVGFVAYAWTLVAVVGIPLWILVHLPLSLRSRWRMTRAAGDTLRLMLGIGLQIQGELPTEGGPAVIVANHASYVDGLLMILACREPAALVASTDLERQRIVGTFLRRIGCVFVERHRPTVGAAAVDELASLLRQGRQVIIFPEGSIVRSAGLRPFHLGAFEAAVATQSPVVPVGIHGSRNVVRPGSWRPRRADVTVAIGRPVPFEERRGAAAGGLAAASELGEVARHAVAELCGEPELGGKTTSSAGASEPVGPDGSPEGTFAPVPGTASPTTLGSRRLAGASGEARDDVSDHGA